MPCICVERKRTQLFTCSCHFFVLTPFLLQDLVCIFPVVGSNKLSMIPKDKRVGPTMVYYDASIEYFSASTHLPFALLAIFVLCTFVVLPALVLLLYPTRIFQRSLGCCRVRWLALHAFADAFQGYFNGYYKNGTDGTRDYRYFAGLYIIFRILPLLIGSYMLLVHIFG